MRKSGKSFFLCRVISTVFFFVVFPCISPHLSTRSLCFCFRSSSNVTCSTQQKQRVIHIEIMLVNSHSNSCCLAVMPLLLVLRILRFYDGMSEQQRAEENEFLRIFMGITSGVESR